MTASARVAPLHALAYADKIKVMLVTLAMPHFLDPVVLGTGRPLSFKQRANGTVLIGGGRRAWVDRDAEWTELDFHALSVGAGMVCELFAHMAGAVVNRGWAGIEACMPDEIPVIGASRRRENAFHAFGFSAHGFELGPIVGSIMADLITRGETALPIASFDIQRFGHAATALPTIHPQGATEHE